jgi:hypothetical protein
MSIVHWGQPWLNGGTYQAFQTSAFQAVRNRGEIPMLTWGSWSLGGGVNQPNFRTATIASGAYDSYITQWAQAAKAWGQPFFLRFDHEMNGWWQFPWADQANGNQAGDYVRAWQHVHDIFTSVGATNATWVWCPNISGNKTTPMSQLYPGDNYVDWTCMDGYNFGTDSSGNVWQTFGQVFSGSTYGGYNPHDSYQELLQLAPSKPIMLGELASAENGGSKGAWITDMLQTLPTNFPQVKALVWNDWDEGSSAITWPIESSSGSISAFKSGISSSTYTSNSFGSISGKVAAPGSVSVQSVPTDPTPAPTSGSATLNPVADTYINSAAPTSTAGGSNTVLAADLTGTETAYLRFDLSQLAGKQITSATLRLHTDNQSSAGSAATFDIKLVGSVDWSEQYMSWNNRVPVSSYLLGSLVAPANPNTWYQTSLNTSHVQTKVGGQISIAVSARTGDLLVFNSREAGSSVAPQLIVSYQ